MKVTQEGGKKNTRHEKFVHFTILKMYVIPLKVVENTKKVCPISHKVNTAFSPKTFTGDSYSTFLDNDAYKSSLH